MKINSLETSVLVKLVISYPLRTIATASFKTLSPKTKAYKLTSTCRSLKIARIVSGSVEEIRAPKYKVSKNVILVANLAGINCTKPYISAPTMKDDIVVPMIAKVSIAPKLRKKYF